MTLIIYQFLFSVERVSTSLWSSWQCQSDTCAILFPLNLPRTLGPRRSPVRPAGGRSGFHRTRRTSWTFGNFAMSAFWLSGTELKFGRWWKAESWLWRDILLAWAGSNRTRICLVHSTNYANEGRKMASWLTEFVQADGGECNAVLVIELHRRVVLWTVVIAAPSVSIYVL